MAQYMALTLADLFLVSYMGQIIQNQVGHRILLKLFFDFIIIIYLSECPSP